MSTLIMVAIAVFFVGTLLLAVTLSRSALSGGKPPDRPA